VSELGRGIYRHPTIDSELFVVDTFLKDLKSIKKGGDIMGDMMQGPKTACEKETPITKINTEARQLREMSLAALQEALKIEEFLIGQGSIGASECEAEKKEAGGWTEQLRRDLAGTKEVLNTLIGHLATIRAITT